MTISIIEHIPGKDIPVHWTRDLLEQPNQTFTLIITSERLPETLETPSAAERNRIFDLLEGISGKESSEKWIEQIKAARTESPLKASFND